MQILGLVFMAVGLAGMIISVFALIRNNQVYKFRLKLIKEEGDLLKQRVTEGKDYDGFRRLRSLPNYNEMFCAFLTPLSKFYKSLSDFYKD